MSYYIRVSCAQTLFLIHIIGMLVNISATEAIFHVNKAVIKIKKINQYSFPPDSFSTNTFKGIITMKTPPQKKNKKIIIIIIIIKKHTIHTYTHKIKCHKISFPQNFTSLDEILGPFSVKNYFQKDMSSEDVAVDKRNLVRFEGLDGWISYIFTFASYMYPRNCLWYHQRRDKVKAGKN